MPESSSPASVPSTPSTGGPVIYREKLWPNAWIVNNGYTREMALEAVASGKADAVSFGKPFISNPDLTRRLREDAALAAWNQQTFYGGGAEGYTDYPAVPA